MNDSVHDLSVRVAAAHVLKDWVEQQYADLRAEQLADLNDLERRSKTKSVTVEVPGIGDVATLTLPATGEGKVQVVDSDAFAVAVEAFNPDAVETVIRVKPDVQKRILDKAKVLPGDDGPRIVHVTKDGELFPLDGVRHIPPREKGAATQFSMVFKKKKKGDDPTVPSPKEQLLDMVMSGGLSTILTPPADTPAIEAGDDTGADQ